jgi:diguanylate cyclase (GGDEF)-like protein
MQELWFYNWMSRFGILNYRAKIMVMAFIGTHIPLIAISTYYAMQSSPNWDAFLTTVGITLVATLGGTVATLYVLNELLKPVLKTSRALRDYRDERRPSTLPTHHTDEVGTLMADAGTTITHLDAVRDVLEHVDAATGLPNRKQFLKEIHRHAVGSAAFALLVVRFANMNRVVEALDGAQAAVAMRVIAERLRDGLKTTAVLARVGDAEFAIVLPDENASTAAVIAQKLQVSASGNLSLDGLALAPSLVIGIAGYPDDALDMSALLDNAIAAAAAASIVSPMTFHSPKARAAAVERLRMEQELRNALERNELRLHYQPVVDLGGGKVRGAEALMRWEHPERGLVYPGSFIPAAEASGLIEPMGLWVLRESCGQVRRWQTAGMDGLKVAINLSARQFLDPHLTGHVTEAIDAAGIDPSQLEIELTETTAMIDHDHSRRLFTSLRDLGVSIAIDDFGAGYASMSYLRKLPFDKLKIDREFVVDVQERRESQAICEALIALSRGLKLDILAEGVESDEEVDYLIGIGLHSLPGLLLRPTGSPGGIRRFGRVRRPARDGEDDGASRRVSCGILRPDRAKPAAVAVRHSPAAAVHAAAAVQACHRTLTPRAAASALGSTSASMSISWSSPTEMRMQRSRPGAMGLRMKTSRASVSCSTFSAKAPSAPQSMVTKLVADGIGSSPVVAGDAGDALAAGGAAGHHGGQIVLVGERGLAGHLRHLVDAVMVAHLLEAADHRGVAEGIAAAQAGEAVGFGEGPKPGQVRP